MRLYLHCWTEISGRLGSVPGKGTASIQVYLVPCLMGAWSSLRVIKRSKHEAGHWPPSTVEVKNVWMFLWRKLRTALHVLFLLHSVHLLALRWVSVYLNPSWIVFYLLQKTLRNCVTKRGSEAEECIASERLHRKWEFEQKVKIKKVIRWKTLQIW
jgi:hypothetical protein